jgi:hypothetical protein
LGLWILIVLLACNLSSEGPATLLPKATNTPQPTLGFATLAPNELPSQVTAVPATNFVLLNLLDQVDNDRLMFHVDALEGFGTRHVNSPYDQPGWGIGAAYTYIKDQFNVIGAQTGNLIVQDYEFPLTWGGVESRAKNIFGYIQGTETGAGTILISAHYDSVTTDPEDGASLAPGANDNGSGVAALIELARILSTRQHRATILFVAFSAEEVGRKGSTVFVRDYIIGHNIDVKAVINLDIIGSSTGPNGAINDREIRLYSVGPNDSSSSRKLARAVELMALNNRADLLITVQDREDRENRYSDHLSFSEVGIPAVRFIEADEDPKRQHNQTDTSDDVQADYLVKSTRTVLTTVLALADGLRPPQNLVLRDAGNGQRTLAWEPILGAVDYIVAVRRPNSMFYNYNIPIPASSVTWDKFIPTEFAAVVVMARDEDGLVGPPSQEYLITQ